MYKSLLILRYLRKRRIAWVSLIAVMLCTTMVLVVISVMGGWLRMFKQSFHGLSGDVIVHGESLTGFPDYEEMATELRKLPQVAAVVPTIETFGLININNIVKRGVDVVGYPIEDIGKVNRFPESLYLGYQQYTSQAGDATTAAERDRLLALAKQHGEHPTFDKPLDPAVYRSLPHKLGDPANWPGMILGVGVLGIQKNADGRLEPRAEGLYEKWVKLDVIAVSADSASPDLQSDRSERNYWIADDSRTNIWQSDNQTVYVPFDILQRDLRMDQRETTDDKTGAKTIIPARTRDLQVAVKPGYTLEEAKRQIELVVDAVKDKRAQADLTSGNGFGSSYPITVETWEESQKMFIDAIENEKVLVTVLFSLISVVAIFLIFCIFYMIVAEKTRDIGIIKSVGATSGGIAAIFLGYGFAIGIFGGGLGLLLGYLIVHNINYLHSEMGKLLGIVIWKPEVYAFDTIPNTMDPKEATIIVSIAIVSAVLGALLPAVRAARMNPVEALRFE